MLFSKNKHNTLFECRDTSIIDLKHVTLVLPEDDKGNVDVWMTNGRCLNLRGGRAELVEAWKAI